MALTDKLSAIGDAIRAKTGETGLLRLDEMPGAIAGIQTGGTGGIPEDIFLVTGDISNRFKDGSWDYFMETEPWRSMFRSENITKINGAFSGRRTLTQIPFTLNFGENAVNPTKGITIESIFTDCVALKELPELGTPLYPTDTNYSFQSVESIKEIPESWAENLKGDVMATKTANAKLPYNCYSLRTIPEKFVKKIRNADTANSSYSSLYNAILRGCNALDEIRGIAVYGNFNFNAFSNGFGNCYRLENIIFETNEDGSAKTANWKSQVIDLSNQVGYGGSTSLMSRGFTDTDVVSSSSYKSAAEFEVGVAKNPNWIADDQYVSRYTRRSAVNTFNSLPDTSAYLAANGGTNTIKLKKASAAARNDNGYSLGIENLTPEEIAIATAKGWTVSLV